MAINHCNNCGVQVEETARFCRRCGQPVSRFDPGPRGYVSPTDYEAPTRPMNDGFTTPSYYPPSPVQPMQVPSTSNLGQGSQTRKVLWIVALILVLLVGFTVISTRFVVGLMSEGPAASAPQAPGVHPPAPPIPAVPPVPPVPPPPPPVTEGSGAVRVDVPRYPGAEQVMEMVSPEEGNVVQLQTTDSISKVTDWYKARINSTKNITLPGGVSVLRGHGLTVVITPAGDNLTHIVIKQGEER